MKKSAKTVKQLHKIKHRAKNLSSHPGFQKGILFVLLFGAVGAALLFITRAATPTINLEPEQATLTGCASTVDDTTASNTKAVTFGCVTPPATSGFVHPGVVYTKAEIDAWSTSSPEYTRLAANPAGSLTTFASMSSTSKYYPVVYGTEISSVERDAGLRDQSGFAKVQAVLWAADNNTIRKDKVVAYLNEFRTVTSFQWDSSETYRLVAGWGCTNLAQAAEIINYQDAGFKRFLKDECYPIMDWPTNPNWHASFADSKLAIAAYLGDEALWTDAKAYFHERIAQSIYHSKYDNGLVKPMHDEDKNSGAGTTASDVPDLIHAPPGTVTSNSLARTVKHWGYDGTAPQITTNLKAEYPVGTPMPDGTNAERRRDLGHVSMSLGAWMHAMRTIRAQGQQVEPQAYDRLLAAYSYHSQRVLTGLQTGGSIPAPVPVNGFGSEDWHQSYHGARKLFGAATPASVLGMLARTEVTTYTPVGTNHMVAEAFADQ